MITQRGDAIPAETTMAEFAVVNSNQYESVCLKRKYVEHCANRIAENGVSFTFVMTKNGTRYTLDYAYDAFVEWMQGTAAHRADEEAD